MLIRNRPDGNRIRVPGFTKIVPILMPTRTESTIYMEQEFALDGTLAFIEEFNKTIPEGRRKLTLHQVFLTAMARTVGLRPRLNRFVSNYRYYQRNHISVSFTAKKQLTDDGKEVQVTLSFEPDDTLDDVNERFTRHVETAKSDGGNKSDDDVDFFSKLPIFVLRMVVGVIRMCDKRNWITRGMLRLLPFYATAYMTNVGSLQLDAPLHHNYEIGNCGIFVALGIMRKIPVVEPDGSVRERTVAKVTYTFDDRIVDGIYSGRAMELVRDFVENPAGLTVKPEVDPELRKELMLSEKGRELWGM